METESPVNSEKKERKPLPQAFKKWVSGNPAGKPKWTRSFSTIAREALIKLGMSEEILVEAHLRQAMEDPNIRKDVFDRIYGKAMQPTDLTSQWGRVDGIRSINISVGNE